MLLTRKCSGLSCALAKAHASDLVLSNRMLKENLEQERRRVSEATTGMKEAHEKEMHAHQQLSDLQAFDKDHDYWPQVLKKKDEELIQLRNHIERLSTDSRRLIADNQEQKARFEMGRTTHSKYVSYSVHTC